MQGTEAEPMRNTILSTPTCWCNATHNTMHTTYIPQYVPSVLYTGLDQTVAAMPMLLSIAECGLTCGRYVGKRVVISFKISG